MKNQTHDRKKPKSICENLDIPSRPEVYNPYLNRTPINELNMHIKELDVLQ
jgi:hypothetical protein